MKLISRSLPNIATGLLAMMVGLSAVAIFGQNKAELKEKNKGFCDSNNWSGPERVSFRDLREMTLPSGGELNVDSNQNGGISVKGEARNDVLVRACVQTWGTTEEDAKAIAAGVKINSGQTLKAENSSADKHWSVSYQIRVPRSTNLNLSAHNGGISIMGVDGTVEFETMNGGVFLSDMYGSVKGRTTNGGVNVELRGTSWKGSGLDVVTTNGGVHLTMPENYAAHIETGTVNGGFSSNIPGLNVEKNDSSNGRQRAIRINTDLNGGGSPIRVITTNGGIRISSSNGGEKY